MEFLKNKIQELLQEAISQNVFSKAVVGLIFPDGDTLKISINTDENSIFDIASLTKVCPTSTVALKYILDGKLKLDTKVIDYIPELQTNYREDIQVYHLLTHSLDYRLPMKTLREFPPEQILDTLYHYQFQIPPGNLFNYGNPPSVLLGILLNRLTHKSLKELGEEILFKPLQMNSSLWDPLEKFPKNRIIPTEMCPFRNRMIQGEIHDESAFVLRQLFPVGSAGMFSTIPDLMNFVQMLLQDGIFENQRIIPEGILEMISKNAFPKEVPAETALGFELNQSRFMGSHCSKRTFGKTGFTGASFVADAEKKAAVLLLSNFTWPTRESSPDRINQIRAKLSDLFFQEI